MKNSAAATKPNNKASLFFLMLATKNKLAKLGDAIASQMVLQAPRSRGVGR
jgi:hypothetical protein